MNHLIEPLTKISDSFLKELEKSATTIEYDKANPPFDYDDTLHFFYIFLSGKVKIFQMNLKNNKELTLYLLTKGDMFDIVTLLDGKEHDIISEVLEPGKVLRLPIKKVREWMIKYPKFAQAIFSYTGKQIRRMEELASDLTLLDTQERFIKLLIQNLESIKNRGVDMLENLSHAEMAKMIGTVRHVIDRHIKQLKEDGILSTQKRKIMLNNAKELNERLEKLL